MSTATKRTRRTPEQQITDLKLQIAKIQERAEQQKLKKDPTLRHIAAALRSVDKALSHSGDAATRQALDEARATLSACLGLSGAAPKSGVIKPAARRAARISEIAPKDVLRYIASNPGCRCADIATAVDADTKEVSPVLKSLREEGKVRSEGQARGTRYFVGAKK